MSAALRDVKRAANAEAIERGVDIDPAGVDAVVFERLVSACREMLAACQRAHPGRVIGFYVGSTRRYRLEQEGFAWACRSGDPLIMTLDGARLTASLLRVAGFVTKALPWSSNCAINVDEVEAVVQTNLRRTVGSLWRVDGAGGQRQGGPGDAACVFITYGPLPPDCTCAPRAMSFWPEGHGVLQRAAASAAAEQPPPPPSRYAVQASVASFFPAAPATKKRKLT